MIPNKSKQKWSMLRQLVQEKKISMDNQGEHLFQEIFPTEKKGDFTVYSLDNIQLQISEPSGEIGLEEVVRDRKEDIDSTGNVMWPAELLLAKALLLPLPWTTDRSVQIIEIGAGYSAIALFACVKSLAEQAKKTGLEYIRAIATDGNTTCAQCTLLTTRPPKEL
jgi:hypothetical protein